MAAEPADAIDVALLVARLHEYGMTKKRDD